MAKELMVGVFTLSSVANINILDANILDSNASGATEKSNARKTLTNNISNVYSHVRNSFDEAKNIKMRLLTRVQSAKKARSNEVSKTTSTSTSESISTYGKSKHGISEYEVDERILIRDAQNGDKESFRILVEKYQTRLIHCALKVIKNQEEARDIVQDAFVKAYLALPKFKGESSFYTWMYRIVFHLSIDVKRKYTRRGGETLEFDEKIGKEVSASGFENSLTEQPDKILDTKQQLTKLQVALNQISPEHKEIIILREIEGFSYDEIASILNISLGTVMSRLFYGRKSLMSLYPTDSFL